ncbi:MAG: hypothetical protein DHS20C01_12970 [marine bacterium B5-7]|nr:MAG: hypothetical protein DHS20C01_12970 [marine bacterium B5-7]
MTTETAGDDMYWIRYVSVGVVAKSSQFELNSAYIAPETWLNITGI